MIKMRRIFVYELSYLNRKMQFSPIVWTETRRLKGVISHSNCVSFVLKVLCLDHKSDCVIGTAWLHHRGGMTGSPAGLPCYVHYVVNHCVFFPLILLTYLTKYFHVHVGSLNLPRCQKDCFCSAGHYRLSVTESINMLVSDWQPKYPKQICSRY